MNQKALTAKQRSILSKIRDGGELIPFKSGNHTSYVIKHGGKRVPVMPHTVASLIDRGYLTKEIA